MSEESRPLNQIREVIDRNVRTATLDELTRGGRQKFKVMKMAQFYSLVDRAVNNVIQSAADRRPPRAGRRGKILYATQIGVFPPTFVVFVSDPRAVDNAYRRYLANQLRREYGFVGTPLRILVRRRR